MPARRSCTAVAVVALALGFGSCAGRKGADSGAEPQSRAEATIEVQNQNFYDARVYLVHLGARTRLGQVNGHSTRIFSFALPPDQVRIEVSFIGGGGFVTESMPVSPGDQLVLLIEPDAHRLSSKR